MADALNDQVRQDLNQARKDRDKLRTAVLSTFLSEVKNREIEKGKPATDADIEELLITAIKRRKEASEQMRAGDRPELAEKEEEEARMLQAYLPPQLEESEVREMVRAAVAGGATDIGGVMKVVMPSVKGRFEGKELNRLAREELG